eukprot:CAMPEP_0171774570 /NCGR_PEP_ID=MMETSP0991-20121206/55962_1 /TAXON_ID=483369 /ORGANISM="non described non described, Strain CCMP2098" /LENGTH=63 /DNA_ID=CAMNT_0012380513 /DNA_START=261 /DNA_END=452 /DNA_ORIENTATION=-
MAVPCALPWSSYMSSRYSSTRSIAATGIDVIEFWSPRPPPAPLLPREEDEVVLAFPPPVSTLD